MSREAVGQNGAILGSSDYWERLNCSTYIGSIMQNTSEPAYNTTLKNAGHRASSMIEAIYNDLQKHGKLIRNISLKDRSSLSHQVQALSDVCLMAGISSGHSIECVFLLNQSNFSVEVNSQFEEYAVRSAINQIKNNPNFFASECLSIVKQAADWGIDSAAGNDMRKKAFLESVSQEKGRDFLRQVLESYQSETDSSIPTGFNGAAMASNDYLQDIERQVFLRNLPMSCSACFGTPSYTALLRDSLNTVANTLTLDLNRNDHENNYVTDKTALELKRAGQELAQCGINVSIDSAVNKLAWFVGGDSAKIRKLQSSLNELRIGEHLTEDGVYGTKTLSAWSKFLNDLEHGTVPSLCWIDLLQSQKTGITIGSTKNGGALGLNNAFLQGRHPYIRFDPIPTGTETAWVRGVKKTIDYPHINFDPVPDSNLFYDYIQKQFNHYPLTDDAYNVLKDLKDTGKKVRIGGKVLLVAGIALDALELGMAIDADLKDADRKLGKTTASTAASIGGRWAGAAAGAKGGAMLGAMTGPAAPVAIPVLSIVGGIAGSFGGDYFAQWVVDITYAGE